MNNDDNGLDFEVDSTGTSRPSIYSSYLKNDPERQNVARQSYRFPIHKIEAIEVAIADQIFKLMNIVVNNRTGIGIQLENETVLSPGQDLSDIHFKLLGNEFNLQGRVRQISPDNFGKYICGIELTDLTDADQQTLQRLVHTLRSRLFAENEP
jgi:predicted nucleic acid-binding OB-fold protein